MKKRTQALTVFVIGLPMLLHVYNPSLQLEALGLILWFIGLYVSPIVVFWYLLYLVFKK